MEILELNLKHFGKFREHKIELHPGINIIYGGNETGKTTIHAFIRAMFFGIERGRGKAGRRDEYQLRQPWENPSYFAGTMRVRYEGKIYRIERNFYKNDREVHLICEDTGEELSMQDGELSGLLAGMSETAFKNTVFIPQAGCETDAGLAQELQKFMVNFQETGDGGLDISGALDRLKEKKKNLEAKKKQELEKLDEQLARKQMEMDYVNGELEQKKRQSSVFGEGTEEIDGHGKERSQSRKQPERENGLEGESRWESEGQEDSEAERETERSKNFYHTFLIWINGLLLLSGVLGYACCIFAGSVGMRIGMFLTGTVFTVLFGMTFRYMLRKNRACFRSSSEKTRGTQRQDHEDAEETKNSESPGEKQERRQREEMLRLAEKTLAEGKKRWKKEEHQKELQEKTVQLEVIRNEMEQLYEQREQLICFDREMEAVDLAMLRIRELSGKIYREARTQFGRTASEILAELTEGRYTQLALDEKMEVRVNTPSRLLYLHQVSYGTMNQIYFALRMAAGKILSYGQPVPVILDEAFSMYDDERLEAALRWLDGCGRQVILFSCQTREKVLLDRIRRNNL